MITLEYDYVRTLTISKIGQNSGTEKKENKAQKNKKGIEYSWGLCSISQFWDQSL